jgi:hypothetical protein
MFERMQAMMAQAGVTEEDIVEDLKRLRKDERQKKARG